MPLTMAEPSRPDERGPAPSVPGLLSDETTVELLVKAQAGDRMAVEALLERCIPRLRRWAHGRLPPAARANLDTDDLVQETVLHVIRRLDQFEPRHVGAMQGYLRRSVINRIRDEVRKVSRQPEPLEMPDDLPSDRTSPIEAAIGAQTYDRYRAALSKLAGRERELVVARVEAQWNLSEIADRLRLPSVDAARMAVKRALLKLASLIDSGSA